MSLFQLTRGVSCYLCDSVDELESTHNITKRAFREELLKCPKGGASHGASLALKSGCIRYNHTVVLNGGIMTRNGDVISFDLGLWKKTLQIQKDTVETFSGPRRMMANTEGLSYTRPPEDRVEAFTASPCFKHYQSLGIQLSLGYLNPLPITIRVNMQHKFSDRIEQFLSLGYHLYRRISFKGIALETERTNVPIAYMLDRVKEGSKIDVLKIGQEIGLITQQELSSMVPSVFLIPSQPIHSNPKPHIVLDLCASPGSKTSQLLDSMGDDGILLANDLEKTRAVRIAKRLQNTSPLSHRLMTSFGDGRVYPPIRMQGYNQPIPVSKILVDAPCSGDGTLRKNPKKMAHWNASAALRNHDIQFELLENCVLNLATQATEIVYSTCSLNPVENEDVILRLLQTYPDRVALAIDVSRQDRTSLHPPFKSERFERAALIGRISPELDHTRDQGLPQEAVYFGGFFVAKLIVKRSGLECTNNTTKGSSRDYCLTNDTGFVRTMSNELERLDTSSNNIVSKGIVQSFSVTSETPRKSISVPTIGWINSTLNTEIPPTYSGAGCSTMVPKLYLTPSDFSMLLKMVDGEEDIRWTGLKRMLQNYNVTLPDKISMVGTIVCETGCGGFGWIKEEEAVTFATSTTDVISMSLLHQAMCT